MHSYNKISHVLILLSIYILTFNVYIVNTSNDEVITTLELEINQYDKINFKLKISSANKLNYDHYIITLPFFTEISSYYPDNIICSVDNSNNFGVITTTLTNNIKELIIYGKVKYLIKQSFEFDNFKVIELNWKYILESDLFSKLYPYDNYLFSFTNINIYLPSFINHNIIIDDPKPININANKRSYNFVNITKNDYKVIIKYPSYAITFDRIINITPYFMPTTVLLLVNKDLRKKIYKNIKISLIATITTSFLSSIFIFRYISNPIKYNDSFELFLLSFGYTIVFFFINLLKDNNATS